MLYILSLPVSFYIHNVAINSNHFKLHMWLTLYFCWAVLIQKACIPQLKNFEP